MGISQKTFSEIKDILHKLDRSIDHVRESRQRDDAPDRPSTNGPALGVGEADDKNRKEQDRPDQRRHDDPHTRRIG